MASCDRLSRLIESALTGIIVMAVVVGVRLLVTAARAALRAQLMPGCIRYGLAAIVVAGALMAMSPFVLADVPPHPDALELIDFDLADVHYRVSVPKWSRLGHINRPGCIKIWHLRATRLMTFLELCSALGDMPSTFTKQATLTNGAHVRYTVDHDIGGGSGGTEGELKGRLDLDGRVLVLTCRDQGEGGNSPDWCLQYLGYLEFKERM
jgi:Tse3 toxin immunity protein Tsi3